MLLLAGAMAGCGDDDDTPPPTMMDGGRDMGMTDMAMVDMGPPTDGGRDAGQDGGGMLPTTAPTTFVRASFGNFRSPTDAVASNDGATFYFAAFDTMGRPGIFAADSSATGDAAVRHTGSPLEYPSGLALGCDGATLYIVDPVASGNAGAVFSMPVSGTAVPMPIAITGFTAPNAVAIDDDCMNLVVSGRTDAGVPAIARVALAGGAATIIASGGELRAPTGVFVDAAFSVWALDHLASGPNGRGALFHVIGTAAPVMVASGLALGTPGGLAFPAGGGRALIGSRDAAGASILTIVDATTMAVTTAPFTGVALIDPGGLRSARSAGVFAIVDTEGAAIYRGQ